MYNVRDIIRRGIWIDIKTIPNIFIIWGLYAILFENAIIEFTFVAATIINSMMTGAFHYLEDLEVVYKSRKNLSIEWAMSSLTSAIGFAFIGLGIDLIAPYFIDYSPVFLRAYPDSSLVLHFLWLFSVIFCGSSYARLTGFITFQVNILIGMLVASLFYVAIFPVTLAHENLPPLMTIIMFFIGAIICIFINYKVVKRKDVNTQDEILRML